MRSICYIMKEEDINLTYILNKNVKNEIWNLIDQYQPLKSAVEMTIILSDESALSSFIRT